MDKTKKAKGPIRWEAVIPVAVIMVLIGVYFTMFFDNHVRRGLEYVGTQVHGAEVNIGYFRTSFIRASLDMGDIQITDKNKPARNLVQVGSIHFKMLWDALLRAKVVVDEASILDIQALVPRKTPGYVVPPPPPSEKGTSLVEKAQTQVMAHTRKKLNQNFLGDVVSILSGVDPKDQLKNIQTELKSDARVKELEKELKAKKELWEQRIKELPQAKDFKQYEARIKALKFDTKNPSQFAKDLKEAEKVIKEADQKVKLVEQTTKDVKNETNAYTQAFKDLERMVQEDIDDLQKRLKLPNVDGKEFSQQLFMQLIEQKLVSVRKYVEMGRQYMPPKRSAEEKQTRKDEQLVPRPRGQGKNYDFPITTGYPLFWLKYAAISSSLATSDFGGSIKGEIKDITTSPSFIKKPALILVMGDFPKQGIHGLDARITIDHTTDKAKESMVVKVDTFPVGNNSLSDSSDVKLVMQEATGSSVMTAELANEQISMEVKNTFNQIKFDLEAKNKHVKEIIGKILAGIPVVTLNARIKGSFENFDIGINSNLGEELANGFKAQLQAKIDEAKGQLKKMIDQRIGGERDKLKGEMDKTIGELTKNLDGKKSEIDGAMKQTRASMDSSKKDQSKKLEQEGKKLLKKFGL